MKRQFRILLHIGFWLYKFVWGPVVGNIIKQESLEALSYYFNPLAVGQYALYLCTFYVNYFFIMPRYYKAGKMGKAWLGWLLLMLAFILCRFLVEEKLLHYLFGISNYSSGTTVQYYIYDNLYFGGPLIVMSVLFWILDDNLTKQKERYMLLEEKKSAQLSFLKNQVNPHFIFNTLNNIYSLVSSGSQQALQAISKLSELMRYMYKDSDHEKVPLQNELQYINSFIELQKIRLVNPGIIQFTAPENAGAYQVAPLLLIPFIENIFKHGIINNIDRPINITISLLGNQLKLKTSNAINALHKDEASGVGLSNVKKRLELLYPHKYSLKNYADGDQYCTALRLELDANPALTASKLLTAEKIAS